MSAKRLVEMPRARLDVREIVADLADRSPTRAARFYAAYKETLALLRAHPEMGERCPFTHPRLTNLRWRPLRDFRTHLIFTEYDGETVTIVRVLYQGRNIQALLEDEGE